MDRGLVVVFAAGLLAVAVLAKTFPSAANASPAFSSFPAFGVHFSRDERRLDHKKMAARRRSKLREMAPKERQLHEEKMFQPAPCIWAVLACCAPTNYQFRFGCFPYLGCSTLFWQTDPCQLQSVLYAAQESLKFYQQFDKRRPAPATTPPPPTATAPTEPSSTGDSGSATTTATTTTAATVTETETTTASAETTTEVQPT